MRCPCGPRSGRSVESRLLPGRGPGLRFRGLDGTPRFGEGTRTRGLRRVCCGCSSCACGRPTSRLGTGARPRPPRSSHNMRTAEDPIRRWSDCSSSPGSGRGPFRPAALRGRETGRRRFAGRSRRSPQRRQREAAARPSCPPSRAPATRGGNLHFAARPGPSRIARRTKRR